MPLKRHPVCGRKGVADLSDESGVVELLSAIIGGPKSQGAGASNRPLLAGKLFS